MSSSRYNRERVKASVSAAAAAMQPSYRSLITVEPGKRGGRACIRGMRISVGDVLSYLAAGMSIDDILADFSYLTREDVQACLAFAADRERATLHVAG